MALMRGDGSLRPDADVEVPVFAELARYTGEFVSTTANAWAAVSRFVASGDLAAAGDWVPL